MYNPRPQQHHPHPHPHPHPYITHTHPHSHETIPSKPNHQTIFIIATITINPSNVACTFELDSNICKCRAPKLNAIKRHAQYHTQFT
ncbi:LOW QUALITY PROTEIN: uncharacterized protein Dyak_GE28318 [Drosophila yakuba]|uniref:Uncharacterized protein n=1 Tax=Drosophila yakuba TaxID=7245 RepID=A0A0R1EH01_DROYA|nr:LOW QUALITY PROTEIN: uncharacterized protein Dyak_GE28318 [Drosophila yakuba]